MRVWNLFMYAMKNMFKYEGRACRMEAISLDLFHILGNILLGIPLLILYFSVIVSTMGGQNSNVSGASFVLFLIFALLYLLFNLVMLFPSLSVCCRRLHDLNVTGWAQLAFIILAFIPFLSFFSMIAYFIVCWGIPGTEGDNNYGPVSENY